MADTDRTGEAKKRLSEVQAAIARLNALRQGRKSPGLSPQEIKELIEVGRR